MPGDRDLSFLAHSSPGNGLLACKKRMGISLSSSLGCARDDETGKGISHISFQPIAEANLRPFGAPPSKGRRENAAGIGLPFLAHRLRGVPLRRKEGECRFPHRHFERKREIFFVRGQAKNVRGAGNGKHCPPCDWGGRCFMQTVLRRETETGNEKDPSAALGMTKRGNVSSHFFSFRCEPTSAPSGHLLPEEGGSVHASPFPWKGLPSAARRGWLPFLRRSRLLLAFSLGEGCVSGIAVFSYLSLPHWGRGTASAVDRVLSLMAYLRRSPPLSFIPLVPYPARAARHLPLEGKALFRKYRYPHPTSAPSGASPSRGRRGSAAFPIANPFPASLSRNLPLFCGTI